jgi:hypothetical protein
MGSAAVVAAAVGGPLAGVLLLAFSFSLLRFVVSYFWLLLLFVAFLSTAAGCCAPWRPCFLLLGVGSPVGCPLVCPGMLVP